MWDFRGVSTIACVLLITASTLVYLYIRRQFSFWKVRGVLFKKPHWLLGSYADFVSKKCSLADLTLYYYNEFKSARFGGIWQIHTPSLFVIDPELLRDIMVKDFDYWSSRGAAVNIEVDPLSSSLVNLDGKMWKSVRAKLTPTFTSGKLKQMHHLLLQCGKSLEAYLEVVAGSGEPIDAREMSARFTTDVIGSCVFGIEMNSLSDEDAIFRRMGRKVFEPTTWWRIARALQFNYPRLFMFLNLSAHDQELIDFFLKITKETIEYRDERNVERHDFIDLLRSLRNTGEPLEEDEVDFDYKLLTAQAFVFFAAGFETSSTAISYCLHELAVNEDIQQRLRDEVHRTKAANNGELTWDGLKNMKYLDMVVQETLRKYPPAPLIGRTTVKPYRIPHSDVELPKGTKCIIPIYALHHDAKYYPDPDKFDPERFTEEAKRQRPAFTFLPFGGGPRVCIGLRFAEQQTKLGLVKMVDKFKVSLCEKSSNPLQHNLNSRLLSARGGVWIKVSKLASSDMIS